MTKPTLESSDKLKHTWSLLFQELRAQVLLGMVGKQSPLSHHPLGPEMEDPTVI